MTGHQETMDATTAAVASKATIAGAGASVLGWAASSNFGMWAGIVIGVVGLAVNFYFKHRDDKREQLEHEARMRKLARDSEPMPFDGKHEDD